MPIRVVVVDDQVLVRTGLAAIVGAEDDLDVVGQAGTGREALLVCESTRPDVVLMDIRMPVMDGVEATARLLSGGAQRPRVLVLTTFDLDELVQAALEAGASGFLLKDCPPEELVRAIRVVAAGDAMLAPSVTRRLLSTLVARPTGAPTAEARASVERLTDREREVLQLLARGRTNVEIGELMYVAETTVKTHVSRIFMKLGVRDRVQATVVAFDAGLVIPGSG